MNDYRVRLFDNLGVKYFDDIIQAKDGRQIVSKVEKLLIVYDDRPTDEVRIVKQ